MWRLKQNIEHNGNLYPTHGLGPIAQCMNINRGDKMDYLVSVSTNDFTLNNLAKEMAAKDSFFNEYVNKTYRGNMNTTTIRTNKGKTIMLQHDVLLHARIQDCICSAVQKALHKNFPSLNASHSVMNGSKKKS